nr:cobaltochelatase subunit CobN [Vulcanisaeta sp. JCM 14467]
MEADAVIHLGTHGTLEFLPGKQVGLSSSCAPDALLGNIPNVYVYHVVVVGEGTIAKRRSYAVLVSHLSPRITESGLGDELRRLRDLIDEYREAKLQDPPRAEAVLKAINEIAVKYGLGGLDIDSLHDEIARMERSAMPYGLRVLGSEVSNDEVLDYLAVALRRDQGIVKSLHRLLAEAVGYDYDELLEHPGKYLGVLRAIDSRAREVLKVLIERGVDDAVAHARSLGVSGDVVREVLGYAKELAERLRLSPKLELENVVRALSGEYIPPGVGGDYVLDPDVLPAGRNLYALDPLKIPSESALELGARMAEESVRRYLNQSGRYPETVGLVVWGGQEVRTRGVTIGQALRYLGVRMRRGPSSREPKLEVIPLEELGRLGLTWWLR